MLVYRIVHKKFADKLVSSGMENRWNQEGQMVIYTSSSESLACLENLVHTSGESLHTGLYVCLTIHIPENGGVLTLKTTDLPTGSNMEKLKEAYHLIGTNWYNNNKDLLLEVPSAIIPSESNYIINTRHDKFKYVKIKSSEPFRFDERLKR